MHLSCLSSLTKAEPKIPLHTCIIVVCPVIAQELADSLKHTNITTAALRLEGVRCAVKIQKKYFGVRDFNVLFGKA